ncbi:MAG: hypothetical protein J7551_01435 [Chloroflexi bacterium]|nr:hypothetical protein [Chloroflexota bacterium]
MSELNKLLEMLPRGTSAALEPNHSAAIYCPTEHSAKMYVRAPLLKEDAPPDGARPPFVIISAVGAMGKSALARYIAYEKGAHVWDVSRLTLGTNTFRGTLAESFSINALPALFDDLRNGRILFVLDALDEAEIASGWQRVEIFLSEIYGFVKDAAQTCIVLIARNDTAQYIKWYLDDLTQNNTRCCLSYRIDYFVENQAEDFIRHFISARGRGTPPALKQAIQAVFEKFYRTLSEERHDERDFGRYWQDHRVRSFLGYAPVLQAIANFLSEHRNYMEVIAHFSARNGAQLVCEIIESLLEREQGKLVDRLRERLKNNPDVYRIREEDWQRIYTPAEQLKRLFLYTRRQDAYTPALHTSAIPDGCLSDYVDTLRSFLPQHPFLLDNRFAGPAFEEYAFARLLDEPDFCERVKEELDRTPNGKPYILSPLFAELYLFMKDRKVPADVAGYLYESVASRAVKGQFSADIVPDEDGHKFIITDRAGDETIDCTLLNGTAIFFARQLTNVRIETEGEVVLGCENDFELSDCSLIARRITIRANALVVRSYTDEQFVALESPDIVYPPALTINCNNKDRFLVFSQPLGYPWSEYRRGAARSPQNGVERIAAALRSILSFFRKNDKGAFARHTKYIDNVVVGRSPMRQAILQYLMDRKLVTANDNRQLYFLDWRELNARGVNWDQLRHVTPSQGFQRLVEDIHSHIQHIL